MQNKSILLNLKAAFAGGLARPAALLWFVAAAIVSPLVLLTLGGSQSNNLPWYFWTTILSLLAVAISVGLLRFTRESRQAEVTSISPDRRRLPRLDGRGDCGLEKSCACR